MLHSISRARKKLYGRKINAKQEADVNLAGKFITLSSNRILAIQRCVSARARGQNYSVGSGLSTKIELGNAMRRAKSVVVSRGLDLVANICNDVKAEGFVRDPKQILFELLELHVFKLECKFLNKDTIVYKRGRVKEIITLARIGTDGFPVTSVSPSFTQLSISFTCMKDLGTATVFQRIGMYAAHTEDSSIVQDTILWFSRQLESMMSESKRSELSYRGVKITLLAAIPTVDWSMTCKLLSAHTSSSLFVGFMRLCFAAQGMIGWKRS